MIHRDHRRIVADYFLYRKALADRLRLTIYYHHISPEFGRKLIFGIPPTQFTADRPRIDHTVIIGTC